MKLLIFLIFSQNWIKVTPLYKPLNLISPVIWVKLQQDTLTGEYTFIYTIANKDTFIPEVRWAGFFDTTFFTLYRQDPNIMDKVDKFWMFKKYVNENKNGIQKIRAIIIDFRTTFDSSTLFVQPLHTCWKSLWFLGHQIISNPCFKVPDPKDTGILPGDTVKVFLLKSQDCIPGIINIEIKGSSRDDSMPAIYSLGPFEYLPQPTYPMPGSSSDDTGSVFITQVLGPVPKPSLIPSQLPNRTPAPPPPFPFPPKNWNQNMMLETQKAIGYCTDFKNEIDKATQVNYIEQNFGNELKELIESIKENLEINKLGKAFSFVKRMWVKIIRAYNEGIGDDKKIKREEGFYHLSHRTLFLHYYFPRER
jgi:hypothetical protein